MDKAASMRGPHDLVVCDFVVELRDQDTAASMLFAEYNLAASAIRFVSILFTR